MFERWHWTLDDVEAMDFEDFIILADAVGELNHRDIEYAKAMRGGK